MQTREPPGAAELRSGLQTVGELLGLQITVSDGDGWELSRTGLDVGLDWYAARGHGTAEAMSLAALQLWEGPRETVAAPERARRRSSIARRAPQEAPLLGTIARLLAAGELLTALPGFGTRLLTALSRGLPADLQALPRHLQWAALLIDAFSTDLADISRPVDSAVEAELRLLLARTGGSAVLRRVLLPDPSRPALQRFERAYALLQPPYARLLALDLDEIRGGTGSASQDASDHTPDGEGIGPDAASRGGDDGEDPGEEQAAAGDSPDGGADERPRQGDGPREAEGADLFAAEHAGFVETVLATPLPADGAMLDAMLDIAEDARSGDAREDGGGGARGAGAVPEPLADYRERVGELAPVIERLRSLWARVIADRVAPRHAPSRHARTAGEDLAEEALAGALAEAAAGIPHPHAFRARVLRQRRTRRAGSTDYLLIVDRSASMQGRAAAAAADAMLVLVESLAGVDRDIAYAERLAGADLELDIRTGLIVYDADAHLVKPLSHGLDDATRRGVHAAVLAPRGSTNDGATLRLAAEQFGLGAHPWGSGVQRRRIAILVSDGGSNDRVAAAHQLGRLRAAGVSVHGVGVGSDDIVERYAPNGHRIDDPRELVGVLETIIEDELP